eukprot:TRINITY_DN6476_c0_g1_i1.p1 TRINITY_DN6476_c0_g1~~TRINITY_DN6476_c0_g1_i1.p1  ORF type:complete len:375 (+),score=85.45 TRINITY_DN6476_c0_g1_i1:1033-2157(+)
MSKIKTLQQIFPDLNQKELQQSLSKNNNNLDETVIYLTTYRDQIIKQRNRTQNRQSGRSGWGGSVKVREDDRKIVYKNGSRAVLLESQEFPEIRRHGQDDDEVEEVPDTLTPILFMYTMFPNVERSVVDAVYEQFEGTLSECVNALCNINNEDSQENSVREEKLRSTYLGKNNVNHSRRYQNTSGNNSTKRLIIRRDLVETVDGEESVQRTYDPDLYFRERRTAIRAFKKKSTLFKKASRAYESGNFREAKRLAEKGRMQAEVAYDYNIAASERIFEENNRGKGLKKLDLHGLHPDEAVYYTCDRIELLKEKLLEQDVKGVKLDIITGWGRGQTGNAVLRPTIEELMLRNNINYKEDTPGKITIFVQPTTQFSA